MRRRHRRAAATAATTALVAVLAMSGPAAARVQITTDEALQLEFPGCTMARSTVYLTDAQRARAQALAGTPIVTGIVVAYTATCNGRVAGTAYFDAHRVRTLPEVLMVAVGADGKLRRVEMLSFDEPQEYMPPPRWYAQFPGRSGGDLQFGHGVRTMTGATLSSRAALNAARRVLAIDAVIRSSPSAPATAPVAPPAAAPDR